MTAELTITQKAELFDGLQNTFRIYDTTRLLNTNDILSLMNYRWAVEQFNMNAPLLDGIIEVNAQIKTLVDPVNEVDLPAFIKRELISTDMLCSLSNLLAALLGADKNGGN